MYVLARPNVGGLQTTLRNRIRALADQGVRSEVAYFEQGEGEYLFDRIPHRLILSPSDFQEVVRNGRFDCLSFIYTTEYMEHVPDDYAGKILYEVRGWNKQVALNVNGLGQVRKVDGVLCIAKYLKPVVLKHLKRHIPVYVDGNAVDPMFRFIRHPNRSWDDCPVPDKNRKVIAFVGRLDRSKNWRQFVRICGKVNETEPIEPWIICNRNDAVAMASLFRRLSRKGLLDVAKVIVHVPNHRMPELYSAVRRSGGCLLSASEREGLGNHVLEPMACGLPIVSSNVPGKNEIIKHRHNGMLYRLNDTDQAVRYVKELLHDKELRRRLRSNGLNTIRRDFNPPRYAVRFQKILSKL
ncbi:glycosyltransferase family 4 protein [Cohnella thailandensis]|uniref:Glycosyltransferase family 4 protein n=1 Tax=Cohnella thailandensis TaxID=557557 RepID=A0A841T423_9BACL|nr:glycosyltransferase family 4 protein [Cohnella thailandensis]MBB6635871.1 glycosyltransferase family 4 protein [Cohnella thailandensis]